MKTNSFINKSNLSNAVSILIYKIGVNTKNIIILKVTNSYKKLIFIIFLNYFNIFMSKIIFLR
jgi:hypothetical protein